MRVINSIFLFQKLARQLKQKNKKIGFVPTMGALHEGHAALLRRSRRDNDISVLSIFVNPKQFGPTEDFSKYPRTLKQDLNIARREKVDFVFIPTVVEMYSNIFLTSIHVDDITQTLCGRSRLGHFDGVATVVGKLLNIVLPDVMYLGQKDAQQVVVLKRMVSDLNFPVKIVVCPTVREKDGLALSSRNKYLSDCERHEALVLYQALKQAKANIREGEHDLRLIQKQIVKTITGQSHGVIDYVACVDTETLEPLAKKSGAVLIALAVKFGSTRLIDNIIVA